MANRWAVIDAAASLWLGLWLAGVACRLAWQSRGLHSGEGNSPGGACAWLESVLAVADVERKVCGRHATAGARWQRLPLLCLLGPLLWLQARHVRRITPRMPEPPGRRCGTAGQGPLIRLLVAGDSGAAGVGASSQDEALCGQLVRRLSAHHTVQWRVLAANGLDSPGLLRLLQDAPCARFDVVVLSMGANDATGLCAPLQWARWQGRLAALIDLRFAPTLLLHSAVPPMHACLALPQPLRWFMGRWARQMNHSLAQLLIEQGGRSMHWHPETTATSGMASDGFHPSAQGYAAWADGLSLHILAAQVPQTGAIQG